MVGYRQFIDKVFKRLPTIPTVILAVTALVVAYFLVGGAFNAIRSHQLREQESQLRSEIRGLQDRYRELTALREYLDSDEYIEAVAREQLGLVRRGETGFIILPSQPAPTPAPHEPERQLWWDILIR